MLRYNANCFIFKTPLTRKIRNYFWNMLNIKPEDVSKERLHRILDFLCHLLTKFNFNLAKMSGDRMEETLYIPSYF